MRGASWAGGCRARPRPASCSMRSSRLCMTGSRSGEPVSCTIATGAGKADSSGRRNGLLVGRSKQLVKRLGGRFPVEGLAGSCIEGGRDGCDRLGAVDAQIGAFWEVLPQQPVGVLIGAALPGAVGVAEVDLDARVDFEARMLGHLGALIPGQRPS